MLTTNETLNLRPRLGAVRRRSPDNREDAGRWAGRVVEQTQRGAHRSHAADPNSRGTYERFAPAVSSRSQTRPDGFHWGNPEGGCRPSGRSDARSPHHRIFAPQAHGDRTSRLSDHLSEWSACLRADANALSGPFHGAAIWRMHSLQFQTWRGDECQDVDADVSTSLVFSACFRQHRPHVVAGGAA